jgi:hypothetical protein
MTTEPGSPDETLVSMHDLDDVDSLSEEILLAMEELGNRSHDELAFYSFLDPDALDALFVHEDGEPRVDAKLAFEYGQYRVDVDTTGEVLLVQVS